VVATNLAGETLCVSTRGAIQLVQILVVVAAIWMDVPVLGMPRAGAHSKDWRGVGFPVSSACPGVNRSWGWGEISNENFTRHYRGQVLKKYNPECHHSKGNRVVIPGLQHVYFQPQIGEAVTRVSQTETPFWETGEAIFFP